MVRRGYKMRRDHRGKLHLAESNLMDAAALYGQNRCAAYEALLLIAAKNYERITRSMRPRRPRASGEVER